MTNFNTNNAHGGAPGPGPQQSTSFRDTVSEIWRTRAYRLPKADGSRAWISGVCEGIAVRYQVDPLLIRLSFVVLALAGGLGIALYAAAVLVMPRRGVEQPAGERLLNWEIPADPTPGGAARRATLESERTTAVIALVVLALCIITGVSILQVGSLAVLAVVAAAIWFLHKRTPTPPEVMQHFKVPAGFEGRAARTPGGADAADFIGPPVPPAWDPLGAAPFAWNQPDAGAPGAARAAAQEPFGHPDAGVTTSALGVPGAAEISGRSNQREDRPRKSRARRILGGLLLTIVIVGGSVLVYFGVIHKDEDAPGSITVGPMSAEQPELSLEYQGMDGRVMVYPEYFAEGKPGQHREMSLSFSASRVDLELPGYTSGPSYWLDLECSSHVGTTGGKGCDDISPVFVPGNYGADFASGKEKPEELKGDKLPHVTLTLRADDAVINVQRGNRPFTSPSTSPSEGAEEPEDAKKSDSGDSPGRSGHSDGSDNAEPNDAAPGSGNGTGDQPADSAGN